MTKEGKLFNVEWFRGRERSKTFMGEGGLGNSLLCVVPTIRVDEACKELEKCLKTHAKQYFAFNKFLDIDYINEYACCFT